MTTKQISEAVGKDERTVQRWAKKTGDKLSSIGDKITSVGKSGIPADYDLEETVAIIETGMGKNAADLFRMAARESQGANLPAPVSAANLSGLIAESVQKAMSAFITKPVQPEYLPAPLDRLSANYLSELRRTFGTAEAARRIDYLLGYKAPPAGMPFSRFAPYIPDPELRLVYLNAMRLVEVIESNGSEEMLDQATSAMSGCLHEICDDFAHKRDALLLKRLACDLGREPTTAEIRKVRYQNCISRNIRRFA